jgi:hypothetical protein
MLNGKNVHGKVFKMRAVEVNEEWKLSCMPEALGFEPSKTSTNTHSHTSSINK